MFRALDLFCCAGGASVGLNRAGFEVVGVDIEYHKNYPFPMVVCDALNIAQVLNLSDFDFIWASPPCQRFSWATPKRCRDRHPDLIEPVRELLASSGARTAMENVQNAPIRPDIVLDGFNFGLPLLRRRIFEVNFDTSSLLTGPRSRPCAGPNGSRRSGPENGPSLECENRPQCQGQLGLPKAVSVTGGGGPGKGAMADWCAAMEIDWMTRREIVEAVPPAYAEAIGRCAIEALENSRG